MGAAAGGELAARPRLGLALSSAAACPPAPQAGELRLEGERLHGCGGAPRIDLRNIEEEHVRVLVVDGQGRSRAVNARGNAAGRCECSRARGRASV